MDYRQLSKSTGFEWDEGNSEKNRLKHNSHDSDEYIDWEEAKPLPFPNLRPSTKTTCLRLPESMLDDLRMLANKRDVPYQSLLKVFLAERINEELGAKRGLSEAQ